MHHFSNRIEHGPSFALWGSELAAVLAPERAQRLREQARRRGARVSALKLGWLAVVVAAASALVVHAAG
jgi:hypothetical protein